MPGGGTDRTERQLGFNSLAESYACRDLPRPVTPSVRASRQPSDPATLRCHRSGAVGQLVHVWKRASQVGDQELLASGADGFAAFYGRHEELVLRFFLRRTGRPELAADLTAETFARALEGRARFDPGRGSGGSWLLGIARHVLAQSFEQGAVDASTRVRLGMERLVLDDSALAAVEELDGELSAAIAEIPAEQRAAIRGRVIEDREYRELAASLECSEAVVRQRVSRGLRTLRTRLEEMR